MGAWLGLAAGASLAWAVAETHRFKLRFATAAVLRPGCPPRRMLHLSDLHLTPAQRDKQRWVQALAQWEPHLVVVTGDFLAHLQAVPAALAALSPLAGSPGVFVLGSNDYFAPTKLNPAKYLKGPSAVNLDRTQLPWGDLVSGLLSWGWVDLDNAAAELELDGWSVSAKGVDDPHLELDRYDLVAGPFADADLRLGVTHAPYLRVLDAMTADGADLIVTGHTHGGQLRVPGFGALVTNCDLPRSMAKGLHRYPAGSDDGTLLHVSAGLGTSPYAPIRFACPPEATLLTLVARGEASDLG